METQAPEQSEAASAPELGSVDAAPEVEQSTEDAAQLAEQSAAATEPELVEVERNGKRYTIPKELEAELLMHSDFTRKTTEVAEQRKALEAQQAQFQQASTVQGELIQGLSHVSAIDRELQQLRQIDLNALAQSDPTRAQQAFIRLGQLKDAREQLTGAITQRAQQLTQLQEQGYAKAVDESRSRAAKEIPDWSPKTDQALLEYVQKQGFSAQQQRAIAADFNSVKALYKSMKYDELMSKKPAPVPAPIAQVVRAKTSERPMNSMSTEDWMKERNKQLKRK